MRIRCRVRFMRFCKTLHALRHRLGLATRRSLFAVARRQGRWLPVYFGAVRADGPQVWRNR